MRIREIQTIEVDTLQQALEIIAQVQPKEIIYPDDQKPLEHYQNISAYRSKWDYQHERAYERLCQHFGTKSLHAFGCETLKSAICASGALIAYLNHTLKSSLVHDRLSLLLNA